MFFPIGSRRSVVHHPGFANSQHREDMIKAPPSLTLGSVVSAVFGRRWACTHLEPMPALEEPRQPHVRIRSPLRPSTCSSSFVQLLFFDCLRTCQNLYSLNSVLVAFPFLGWTPSHFRCAGSHRCTSSPTVGDPLDSLNRRARDSVEES